jgi:hypothetical protein
MISILFHCHRSVNMGSNFISFSFKCRYILIRRYRLEQVLVVEAVMLQLHYGLQTNLVAALHQKRIFKSGLVR